MTKFKVARKEGIFSVSCYSTLQKNMFDKTPPSSANSFLYSAALSDSGKGENLIEGWDLVEHPTFPPPPSEIEDVEHWTRAMIIDATKYKK